MATMTFSEAYYVVFDILGPALLTERKDHIRKPISAFKGYDLVQICTAYNLIVANEFLLRGFLLPTKCDALEEFAETLTRGGCFAGLPLFVADDQVDDIGAKCAFDFDDPLFLSQETPSSFAEYCRFVGAGDPMYWQKIYTRVGLEYTTTSPQGNRLMGDTSGPYLRGLQQVRDRRAILMWAFGFAALLEMLLLGGAEFPFPGWLALAGCIAVQSCALWWWRFGARLSPAEEARLAAAGGSAQERRGDDSYVA